MIHTTNDPATPYEWGKRVVRDLGNARLLTLRGDGHGAITDFNPCVLGWFAPYLENGTLPPEGTVCEQGFDPFATPAAAARTSEPGARWRPVAPVGR